MAERDTLDRDLRAIFASDPSAISDPFPVWNRLREAAPVYPLDDMVLLGRYADVSELLKDSTRFLSNTKGSGSQFEAIRARLQGDERRALDNVTNFELNYVSRTNGDAHARLRRIAQRAFMPKAIAALRERIQWHTDDIINGLDRAGGTFDMKEFAYRLPLRIIGELLEFPDKDLEKLHMWSSAIGRNRGGTDTPALMNADRATAEFRTYVEGMLEELRSRGPQDDGLSITRLFMDAEQDERLSALELTAMFVILLFAGHETTTNLLANGTHALLKANQWSALAAEPDLVPNAVEELLRVVSPTQFAGRVTATDIEWAGTTIPAGQTVFLVLAAANRDPSVFKNPDQLDLRRADVRNHLAFGFGPHFCIGLQLARLEGVVAFETLVKRYPDLKLAASDLEWSGHAMMRALSHLPVQSIKAAA